MVDKRVSVFVWVGPVSPVRSGRRASAVRPRAGAGATVGATAVTGSGVGTGATGLKGSTVT